MNLWHGLDSVVECDRPLAELTSFRAGGRARFFASPGSASELAFLVSRCVENGIQVRYIGGGSNIIVVSDVVDAMVVSMREPFLLKLEVKGCTAIAGAGVSMGKLVAEAAANGVSGVEFMTGVPGTIGGAVMSNAGTRSGRFRDRVEIVDVARSDGEVRSCPPDELNDDDCAVIGCRLGLVEDDPTAIKARMTSETEYRRSTQPWGVMTAGCMFRNPPDDSAGRLIENAGLKGFSVGEAEVSEIHANFLVNKGVAKGSDALKVMETVREKVNSVSGIELEYEVKIW